MIARSVKLKAAAACLCLAAMGMSLSGAEPRIAVPAYNTLTDAEEVELGRIFAAQLEKEVRVVDFPPLNAYLDDLGQRLGAASQRPNMKYTVKFIDSMDINAVSLPGGRIYLLRGLVESVETESEMVAVLSHEVGHIVGRHAVNTMAGNMIAQRVYDSVKQSLGVNDGPVIGAIEKMGGPLVLMAKLHFGRQQETEADVLGLYQMKRAGWDPEACLRYFSWMQRMEKERSLAEDLLSTHPSSRDRAERIRGELSTMDHAANMTENSWKFQVLKAGLKVLPKPAENSALKRK